MSTHCGCNSGSKLIFPCSGAADVGEIADHVARKLTGEGRGRMFCLAGIGGGVGGILDTTKAAAGILAIDGCPMDCAKKTLEKAGITGFEFIRITDMGLAKGQSPATNERVEAVAQKGRELLTCTN